MGRHKKVLEETLIIPVGSKIGERPSYIDLLTRRRSKWGEHAKCVLAVKGTESYQIDMTNVPDLKKTVAAIKAGVTTLLKDVYKVDKPLKTAYDNRTQLLHMWIN